MSRQAANGRAPAPPRPADWAAQYQPGPATPVLTCHRHGCGAKYLDDDPGRRAHIAVFGHSPRQREPEATPPEGDRQS